MYIHEAVQKALEEDKYMYRISWLATLFSGNRKQKAIRPEMRAEPCIEVFMWDGDEVRRSRGWKPDLYELMADDWELMERPQKQVNTPTETTIFYLCDGGKPDCPKSSCYTRGEEAKDAAGGQCKHTKCVEYALNFECSKHGNHQAYREKGNTAENEIAGDAAIEQPEKPLPPKQEYDADSIKKAIVETGKKCKDIIFVL